MKRDPNMIEPLVVLVDKADNPLGEMAKLQAHEEGHLHRAFSVFLFNEKGQIMLQRRAEDKYHSGGLWTNTCCSHPAPGEEVQLAAKRRLNEEMGITVPLEPSFSTTYFLRMSNGLIEHELDHVFIGTVEEGPVLDPKEAMDWAFWDGHELETALLDSPEIFTEWFKLLWDEFKARNLVPQPKTE